MSVEILINKIKFKKEGIGILLSTFASPKLVPGLSSPQCLSV